MTRRLLRLPAVLDLTGLSRSTVYEMMRRGTFPASVAIGERAVGWYADAIDEWISARRPRGVQGEAGASRPAA